ncbi:MAG: outer membrane beta-barrel protein [Bacteroidales bacterium]|nr:outer membrane beta-barrel protein [Bacteroidales bacterium]
MKKILVLVLVSLLLIPTAFSQEKKKELKVPGYKRVSLGVDFGYDFWMNSKNVLGKWKFNRSTDVFATYNFRLKKSNVYFCPGVGFSFFNLYGNAMPEVVTNADDNQTTTFVPIPDDVSYKKAKTTYNYVEVPLELRVAVKRFQIGVGVKFSYLMSATAKYKGDKFKTDDITGVETGYSVKEMYSGIKDVENWKIAAQIRVGYSWAHIYAAYSFTKMYKTATDTDAMQPSKMYPITVGISIMPFR